jgi:hypothetical protein
VTGRDWSGLEMNNNEDGQVVANATYHSFEGAERVFWKGRLGNLRVSVVDC